MENCQKKVICEGRDPLSCPSTTVFGNGIGVCAQVLNL